MTKLEKLGMVKELPCPNCFDSSIKIYSNSDIPKAPSDFFAVCNHCKYKFFFTDDSQTMKEKWNDVEEGAFEEGCPECGGYKIYLELLCDVQSKDCFFLIRCKDNNHMSRLYLRERELLLH